MPGGLANVVAIYALTSAGASVARRLAAALPGSSLFLPARLARGDEQTFSRLAEALGKNFRSFPAHVAVAASGIVVRAIAPLLVHKAEDPAVVVVDQRGLFAVSLVSGHLGGANDLARRAAAILGGQPVITTGSDVEGLPSLELEASRAGLRWDSLDALSRVASALLEGEPVEVHDPQGWLLPGLDRRWPGIFLARQELPGALEAGPPLVLVTHRTLDPRPGWLLLRPSCLCLGLGCNRGTTAEEMHELLERVFSERGLTGTAIFCLASVEAKRDEPGLIELSRRLGADLIFYPSDRLETVAVPNPSSLVQQHMGTRSVCEAAAILAARGGPLIVGKSKSTNATLAVALKGPAAASG